MKHLKSSLSDLREIFDRSVTVRHLAEPFASFDGSRSAAEVRAFMERPRDYDVVGVRRHGLIDGYVNREDLKTGVLDDYFRPFESDLLLDESKSILEGLRALRESPRAYVVSMGRVSGIVTKGDLQKAPVRMWLFGLISLIEMQLLRVIREGWPNERWNETKMISPARLEIAQKILTDRQNRNEAIDLADCLQFCDKTTIVLKKGNLWKPLGFDSKGRAEDILDKLRKLRDELSHAQDILTGSSRELIDLALIAENILEHAEQIDAELVRTLCAQTGD